MIIDDSKFALIEGKISDIQEQIDAGLMLHDEHREGAAQAIREARVELFKLRTLLRDVVEVDPRAGHGAPPAA